MKSGGFPNELRTHGPIFSICFSNFPLCVKAWTFSMVPSQAVRGLTPYCTLFLNANKFHIILSTSVNCAFKVHITLIPWILTFFAWLFSKHDFNIRLLTWFWAFHRPPLPLQTSHSLSLLLCNPSLLCLYCTFLLMFPNLLMFLLLLSSFMFMTEWYSWLEIHWGRPCIHAPPILDTFAFGVASISSTVSFSSTNLYFFPPIVRHNSCCSNTVFGFSCLNMGAIIWFLEVPLMLMYGCG